MLLAVALCYLSSHDPYHSLPLFSSYISFLAVPWTHRTYFYFKACGRNRDGPPWIPLQRKEFLPNLQEAWLTYNSSISFLKAHLSFPQLGALCSQDSPWSNDRAKLGRKAWSFLPPNVECCISSLWCTALGLPIGLAKNLTGASTSDGSSAQSYFLPFPFIGVTPQ